MALRLTLPMLEKHATVKDHIVSILSNDWYTYREEAPSCNKKKYGKNVTYQAAYKSVHKLAAYRLHGNLTTPMHPVYSYLAEAFFL